MVLTNGSTLYCEKAAFICGQKHPEKDLFFNKNTLYPKFLNPNISALINMYHNGLSDIEIKNKLENFLDTGNDALIKEMDDKTMVLGAVVGI